MNLYDVKVKLTILLRFRKIKALTMEGFNNLYAGDMFNQSHLVLFQQQ